MANFYYRALNADRQICSGEVQAESVQQAITLLEAQGLIVESIGYSSLDSSYIETPNAYSAANTAPPVTDIEQEALRLQMNRVLERGKAIVPALRAFLEELPSGRRRRQMSAVCNVLDRGNTDEAIKAVEMLPDYWIPMLSAAISSNDPGRVLREFLDESRRSDELRRQWWLTISYPLLVACVTALLLTAFSFLVVPIFRNMFNDFQIELPGPTVAMLEIASWITSGRILIVFALLVIIGAVLWRARRWMPQSFRCWISDRFGMPFRRSTALARLTRFTADLLEAELDIPSALRIAGFTTNGSRLGRAAWRLAGEIESGNPPKQPNHQRPLTATVLHALRSDLSTASRIRLLREISSSYAERARIRLSWTQGIIEPLAIGVIGGVVGGAVVALFLPLVTLVQVLT
jgi:type IV pilus assembly protein PilC